jgi:hypothetical protein
MRVKRERYESNVREDCGLNREDPSGSNRTGVTCAYVQNVCDAIEMRAKIVQNR